MDVFEVYEKHVQPEDRQMFEQMAEAAKKKDSNLWDDDETHNEDLQGQASDHPEDTIKDVSRETSGLSEEDVNRIATRLAELMGGQKGGNDGDAGTGEHDV